MELSGLRELVEEHTVRYEIWRHYDMTPGGDRVINGFDLELHGTHEHGHTRLTAGCELCSHTYTDLRRLAAAVLPTELRPSEYEIQPFDYAPHAEPGRESEVVLTIQIKHRHEYFAPVDQCEERCLREMVEELAELGIAAGTGIWHHSSAPVVKQVPGFSALGAHRARRILATEVQWEDPHTFYGKTEENTSGQS